MTTPADAQLLELLDAYLTSLAGDRGPEAVAGLLDGHDLEARLGADDANRFQRLLLDRATYDDGHQVARAEALVAFGDLDAGVPVLEELAAGGDPEAKWVLAKMALVDEPDGIPEALSAAAEADHPEALQQVAYRSDDDPVRAIQLLERGAADGHPGCMFDLSRWLNRRGEPGDRDRAGELLRSAAEAGNPEAMVSLGLDEVDTGNRATGLAWWFQAASVNHGWAFAVIGLWLTEQGSPAGGDLMWSTGAEAGSDVCRALEGITALDRGDNGGALAHFDAAGYDGVGHAYALLAERALKHGRPDYARAVVRQLQDDGYPVWPSLVAAVQ